MARYSQKTIENRVIKCLIAAPKELYQAGFVNYLGKTTDTHRYYTEVVSEILLRENFRGQDIPTITRRSTYKTTGHENPKIPLPESPRQEERTAILLKVGQRDYEGFGRILDYQVPLKDKRGDKGIGKIDLISRKGNNVYILELKKLYSDETLLRCSLEAYTYSRIVDGHRLLKDYGLPADCNIIPAALVFEKSQPGIEYSELNSRPHLKALFEALGIQTFIIREEDIPNL